MRDIDPTMMKDMAGLKSVNEADELLRGIKDPGSKEEIKNEYQSLKEVEELKKMVEKQKCLLHAMWLMLKEQGATNEALDKALNEAVLLEKRTDYKNAKVCPNCGKSLQKMENKLFTSKCYYCGVEILDNPYKKYDGLDPYNTGYSDSNTQESEPYVPDDVADANELKDAQDVISQSFEPYDVTKDLNFDDENV